MSKLKLQATDGSAGTVSLKAPASTTGNAEFELTLPGSAGSNGQLLSTNGSGVLSWSDDNSGVSLSGSTNNTIATVSGANALVGEANLTFDGNTLNLTSGSGDARLTLIGTEGNDARISLVADDGDDHIDQWNLRAEAANHFAIDQFESGSFVERLRIDSSGRLITGAVITADTGTYYDDITVNNSNTASGAAGGAGISLISGNDSYGGVVFSDSDAHARGYMKYDHGNDKLILGSANSDGIVIDSSGRVGIGNTAPAASTTIFGGTQNCLLLAGSAAPQLRIASDTSNQGDLILQAGNSGADVFIANIASNGDIVFRTHNGSAHGERVRIYDDGDVKIADGNLVIGTSGHGIDFSVNSSGNGTMTSELLDGYEEGTWTPTYRGTSTAGSSTHATQTGHYIRVGSHVTLWLYLVWTGNSSSSGGGAIGGLPYTGKSGSYSAGSVFWNNYNIDGNRPHIVLHQSGNSSILYLYASGDNNGWDAVPLDDAGNIIGSITYTI